MNCLNKYTVLLFVFAFLNASYSSENNDSIVVDFEKARLNYVDPDAKFYKNYFTNEKKSGFISNASVYELTDLKIFKERNIDAINVSGDTKDFLIYLNNEFSHLSELNNVKKKINRENKLKFAFSPSSTNSNPGYRQAVIELYSGHISRKIVLKGKALLPFLEVTERLEWNKGVYGEIHSKNIILKNIDHPFSDTVKNLKFRKTVRNITFDKQKRDEVPFYVELPDNFENIRIAPGDSLVLKAYYKPFSQAWTGSALYIETDAKCSRNTILLVGRSLIDNIYAEEKTKEICFGFDDIINFPVTNTSTEDIELQVSLHLDKSGLIPANNSSFKLLKDSFLINAGKTDSISVDFNKDWSKGVVEPAGTDSVFIKLYNPNNEKSEIHKLKVNWKTNTIYAASKVNSSEAIKVSVPETDKFVYTIYLRKDEVEEKNVFLNELTVFIQFENDFINISPDTNLAALSKNILSEELLTKNFKITQHKDTLVNIEFPEGQKDVPLHKFQIEGDGIELQENALKILSLDFYVFLPSKYYKEKDWTIYSTNINIAHKVKIGLEPCVITDNSDQAVVIFKELCAADLRNIEFGPDYFLSDINPNPVNEGIFKIEYAVGIDSYTELNIYSSAGDLVKQPVSTKKSAGIYEIELNSNNFAPGIYFYELVSGPFKKSKKLIIQR